MAYVIRNSCKHWGRSVSDEVFKQNRYSCWRDDSPTALNLDQASEDLIAECTKAMLAAWYYLEPDPTGGSVFYLNPVETRKLRGGTLPPFGTSTATLPAKSVSAITIPPPQAQARLSQPGPEGPGRLDHFLDGELGLVRVGGLDIRGAGREHTGNGEADGELTEWGAGVEAFEVGRQRADEWLLRLTAVETF